ncbi:hypothetical protein EVAR_97093_1 [Eumeta japonica]|uniref:Uncharacterized protein n=1 Tax=Eumeta variegata TaxID=151549 RepID=A0A4C1X6M8_EUMVA|nr:hypothetical protein EVAR_97093_1 [Eumeta japonica]
MGKIYRKQTPIIDFYKQSDHRMRIDGVFSRPMCRSIDLPMAAEVGGGGGQLVHCHRAGVFGRGKAAGGSAWKAFDVTTPPPFLPRRVRCRPAMLYIDVIFIYEASPWDLPSLWWRNCDVPHSWVSKSRCLPCILPWFDAKGPIKFKTTKRRLFIGNSK